GAALALAAAGGDTTAYVVYTSGSTGRPKGVEIPHRGVTRLVRTSRYLDLGPEDRVAHASTVSFDAATFEIWGPLLNGGALVVLDPETILSPRRLLETVRRHGVTVQFITTALLHQIVRENPELLEQQRAILFGGERCEPRRVRNALDVAKGELLHVYGPTECTTFATWFRVEEVVDETPVPIGGPVGNTSAFVVDPFGRMCLPGTVGELWLGGDGLARGYLGMPARTAEVFVPNPFAATPGERLYRTGDLVRLLPGGDYDFVGRLDHQVKIRGFRIEPGEIEATLSSHPQVANAVVLPHRMPDGGLQLVAFAEAAPDTVDSAALRLHAAETLPDFMIPAAFLVLDQLPVTTNGKIDRRILAARAPAAFDAIEDEHTAPRDPLEAQLAELWAEVLHTEAVSVTTDFFQLGGHSLLAIRLLARIRDQLGVELPMGTLFQAPTVAAMAEHVRAAMADHVGSTQDEGDAGPRPGDGGDAPPPSFAQQRLWFLAQWSPESAVYNVPMALRLRPADGTELDVSALERSLGAILERHSTLRSRFSNRAGEPVLHLDPPAAVEIPVVDLRGFADGDAENALGAQIEAATHEPFDLAAGPLLRAHAWRLPDGYVLLVSCHHIVTDGWSVGILQRELAHLYTAFAAGDTPALEPLGVQYGDFAAWQRRWLAGEELERQLEHWRSTLDGAAVLELPTDRPRPAAARHRGHTLKRTLPPGRLAAVEALAKAEGLTPFMVLLAAWGALLGRIAGQTDLCVGTPVAGRRHTAVEGLVGFFVNMLVVRIDLGRRPTFRELLERVRRRTLGAFDHQDLPFEKLVEALHPDRDPARHPIFQTAFQLEDGWAPDPFGAFAAESLDLGIEAAKFDLNVVAVRSGDDLTLWSVHDTDLFEDATVLSWLDAFDVLLGAALGTPDRPLHDLPLLGPNAADLVLGDWNDTAVPYPREASLGDLMAEVAQGAPERTALIQGAERLTYGELLSGADRIARTLRRLGVGTEVRVALCLERSPRSIVATLGVLRAGGAYVPLDPGYPRERLAMLLGVVGADVLVTDGASRGSLPEDLPAGLAVVDLDQLDAEPEEGRGEPLPPTLGGDALAYVMFTSGSTGVPKGVAATHRGVIRLVKGNDFAGLGPEETWLHFAPTSFDAATLELYGPLLNGGSLVVAPPGRAGLDEIAQVAADGGVTSLWLTTGLFHQMVDAGRLPTMPRLRQVLTGGDVLDAERARTALRQLPKGARFVNAYGPTENTTFSTCWSTDDPEAIPTKTPIGIPIRNSRVWIVDDRFEPLPPGIPGELLTSGDGVARGYLGRPALTAERFVPDPFSTEPGSRAYRSGDRVAWRPDGDLAFFGRADFQVKVRGFRIEPGEVESVLRRHPDLRQAAVVAQGDPTGGKRLVAFYVPKAGGAAPGRDDLVAHLRASLPEHMVPAGFAELEGLPLDPNGKVNRKALSAMDVDTGGSGGGDEPPATPMEEMLATLWSDLLGVDTVGRHDDFFALGGHSLLATRLLARVADRLGVDLPLRDLFAAPILSELAAQLDGARSDGGLASVPGPQRGEGTADGDALSFAQQRMWFLAQWNPTSPVYNVPTALRLRGPLDLDALGRSLNAIAERHRVLRTRFQNLAGEPTAVVDDALDLAPELEADLLQRPEEERLAAATARVRDEARTPFDLATQAPVRTRLVKLADDDHILVVTFHHIASDGES
ncbi:MAG: amino acid adenylation domain-containing protein, partial [Acidobacteriota bacterium]